MPSAISSAGKSGGGEKVTTETVQIHKPLKTLQNDKACGRVNLVDPSLVQSETAYEKLLNLEPNSKPEKPLKIDLNLYQLER